MEQHNLLIAFLLTFIAGISTVAGGSLTFFSKQTNRSFLSFSLGLAAGMLLFISFVEVFPEALHAFLTQVSHKSAWLYAILAFFGGIAVMVLIEILMPHQAPVTIHAGFEDFLIKKRLKKMSLLIALAVTLHNIPEGIAMLTISISNYRLAFPMFLAIVIHNIPIGISISMPMYHATDNRLKAICLTVAAGMATPVGALLAWLFLLPYWSPMLEGFVLGAISATMAYIAIDELMPTAHHYGKSRYSKMGLICGVALVAIAMLLMDK